MGSYRYGRAFESLKAAVTKARLEVLAYDAPLLERVPGYVPATYDAIVVLPGQICKTGHEECAVIYLLTLWPSRREAQEKRRAEVQAYKIPALEIQADSIDWMWAAIEKFMMTYKANPYQFGVKRDAKVEVGRMSKFKNQRTR